VFCAGGVDKDVAPRVAYLKPGSVAQKSVYSVLWITIAVKPRPHQQQCRRNTVECYKVECCFDIVAGVDGALAACHVIHHAPADGAV